jgi:hypothetical protein
VVEISQLPDIPFDQLSNAANRLNNLLRFHQFLDIYDIKLQIRKLVDTLASRIDKEGDATDCSRLAWLYRRLGEQEAAALLIEQGLQMEPDNEYCLKLKASLSQQGGFVRQAAL